MSNSSNVSITLKKIDRLPGGAIWSFFIHQAWAALFGGLFIIAIIITQFVELPFLYKYDWLFLIAVAIQIFMLTAKLEKPHEVITIILFHLVGLGMEVFKTSSQIGSWTYPGDSFFHVASVPLFSGFMYAAVGSYIARSWRVLKLRFTSYPPRILTVILAVAIYINFFSHHYIYDFRYILFLAVAIIYWKVSVKYTIGKITRQMPLIVGFGLIALVIWIVENVGTYTGAWLYPTQMINWQPVGIEKFGSWFLLMIISFIMVDILYYVRSKTKH